MFERTPGAGKARLLVDAARAQCGKAARFDDHDIEHGSIWLLPTLLEAEPIAQTFAVLERVDPVWRWVVAQENECAHCVEGALERLIPIALDQYARAPDPAAVIEALASSLPNVTRVALAITARFPFPRGRSEPAPSVRGLTMFEGAPLGCPAALRALRQLARRQPALAEDPRLLAASLRQSGATVDPGMLPTPGEPPYEALGDLQLHAADQVRELLLAQRPPTEPPRAWELAFHRRHDTPWRQALRKAKSSDLGAACWRALLGEIEPAASHRERKKVESAPRPPPFASSELPRLSVAVREQLEGRAPGFRQLVHDVADPIFISTQVRALREALERGDDARVIALCESLDGTPLPSWRDWRAMTEQVLDRGAPEPVVAAFASRWVPHCTWSAPELPFPLVARLAAFPSTRALVCEILARLESDRALVAFCQLAPLREAPGVEALLDQWLGTWMAADPERLNDGQLFNDPRLAARLERLAFASPALAVQLYLRRPGFNAASKLIGELTHRFDAAALSAALEGGRPDDDDLACRKAWLLAALE